MKNRCALEAKEEKIPRDIHNVKSPMHRASGSGLPRLESRAASRGIAFDALFRTGQPRRLVKVVAEEKRRACSALAVMIFLVVATAGIGADRSSADIVFISNEEKEARGDKAEFGTVVEITVTVKADAKQFLTLANGRLQEQAPEKREAVAFGLDDRGGVFIEFMGIYNIQLEKGDGERQWKTKTAAELMKEYRDAGFGLLPSERFSRNPIRRESLPMTFLIPGRGFLQVMEASEGQANEVVVRYKLIGGRAGTD